MAGAARGNQARVGWRRSRDDGGQRARADVALAERDLVEHAARASSSAVSVPPYTQPGVDADLVRQVDEHVARAACGRRRPSAASACGCAMNSSRIQKQVLVVLLGPSGRPGRMPACTNEVAVRRERRARAPRGTRGAPPAGRRVDRRGPGACVDAVAPQRRGAAVHDATPRPSGPRRPRKARHMSSWLPFRKTRRTSSRAARASSSRSMTRARVAAAVDVVADEDDRVAGARAAGPSSSASSSRGAAVDVADREEAPPLMRQRRPSSRSSVGASSRMRSAAL